MEVLVLTVSQFGVLLEFTWNIFLAISTDHNILGKAERIMKLVCDESTLT